MFTPRGASSTSDRLSDPVHRTHCIRNIANAVTALYNPTHPSSHGTFQHALYTCLAPEGITSQCFIPKTASPCWIPTECLGPLRPLVLGDRLPRHGPPTSRSFRAIPSPNNTPANTHTHTHTHTHTRARDRVCLRHAVRRCRAGVLPVQGRNAVRRLEPRLLPVRHGVPADADSRTPG